MFYKRLDIMVMFQIVQHTGKYQDDALLMLIKSSVEYCSLLLQQVSSETIVCHVFDQKEDGSSSSVPKMVQF